MKHRRLSLFTLICAAAILGSALATRAEVPPDALKLAGGIALTKDLMSHMKAFVAAVTGNPEVKAEFLKMNEDPAMSPEMPDAVIAKYPKVAAAFKSSSVKPDEFVKGWSVMMIVPTLADLKTPLEDKVARANVDFFNANKEEVTALSQSIDTLDRTTTSPTASP